MKNNWIAVFSSNAAFFSTHFPHVIWSTFLTLFKGFIRSYPNIRHRFLSCYNSIDINIILISLCIIHCPNQRRKANLIIANPQKNIYKHCENRKIHPTKSRKVAKWVIPALCETRNRFSSPYFSLATKKCHFSGPWVGICPTYVNNSEPY